MRGLNIYRHFEDIAKEMEASVKKCGAFIKISIIFKNFSEKLRFFQGLRGFLNSYLVE
jgi:hypothetical protein